MAVIQNPVIGRAKNKAGGMVFSTWKGKNVMRAQPVSVANPQTAPQQRQRSVIQALGRIGNAFRQFYQLGFKALAVGKSQWNVFVERNAPAIDTSLYPAPPTINVAEIESSKGSLLWDIVFDSFSTLPDGIQVAFTTAFNTQQPADQNADILLLLVDIEKGTSSFTTIPYTSTAASFDFDYPFGYEIGDTLAAYGMLYRASDGVVSDSLYFDTFI